MYKDLYQFGFDRAKEQAKSIDGLNGKEEHDAIKVCEQDWYSEEMQEKLQDLEAECEDINPPAEDNDPIQD